MRRIRDILRKCLCGASLGVAAALLAAGPAYAQLGDPKAAPSNDPEGHVSSPKDSRSRDEGDSARDTDTRDTSTTPRATAADRDRDRPQRTGQGTVTRGSSIQDNRPSSRPATTPRYDVDDDRQDRTTVRDRADARSREAWREDYYGEARSTARDTARDARETVRDTARDTRDAARDTRDSARDTRDDRDAQAGDRPRIDWPPLPPVGDRDRSDRTARDADRREDADRFSTRDREDRFTTRDRDDDRFSTRDRDDRFTTRDRDEDRFTTRDRDEERFTTRDRDDDRFDRDRFDRDRRDFRDDVRDTARDVRDTVRDTRDTVRDVRDTVRSARDRSSTRTRADFDVSTTRSADLGLWFQRDTRDGPVISDIDTSGAISRFGFREGDQILLVDGQRVTSERQFVQYLFADDVMYERIPVVVMRGGARETIYVRPSVLVEQITVVDQDPLEQFGIVLDDRYHDRLIVWKVIPRTPAFYAGIRPGDQIVTWGTSRVSRPQQLVQLLESADDDEVLVQVYRGQQLRQIDVDMTRVASRVESRTTFRPDLDAGRAPATFRSEERFDSRPAVPGVQPVVPERSTILPRPGILPRNR